MHPDKLTRLRQRFDNFTKAFAYLSEVAERDSTTMNRLEKEGMIQRLEYTYELAWKCLKDLLEAEGVTLQPVTPGQVIKEAFSRGLIKDGQTWMDLMNDRNLLAHTYNEDTFLLALEAIQNRYYPAIQQGYAYVQEYLSRV